MQKSWSTLRFLIQGCQFVKERWHYKVEAANTHPMTLNRFFFLFVLGCGFFMVISWCNPTSLKTIGTGMLLSHDRDEPSTGWAIFKYSTTLPGLGWVVFSLLSSAIHCSSWPVKAYRFVHTSKRRFSVHFLFKWPRLVHVRVHPKKKEEEEELLCKQQPQKEEYI